MSKYTVKDTIVLSAKANNYKNSDKLQVLITLLDKDKKDLAFKKDTITVGNTPNVSYKFKTEDIAKSFQIDPDEVIYAKGWIDNNGDGKIGYNEEVLIDFIEEEVLITVIVELPHSKETGWGAKGLAGHTAMAIGDRFFDYGPDYDDTKIFDEKLYQADLNQDGDLEDKVSVYDIPNISHYFAPGRPWWGEVIAKRLNKSTINITINDVVKFISLDWDKFKTNIYGTVYKIEFYVKKSQADKMIKWWEDRYKHLKVYSVEPWKGEQCTTTVKKALAYGEINNIDWNTLTPDGILKDLQTEIKSTSVQHKDKPAKVTLIKKEAINWKP